MTTASAESPRPSRYIAGPAYDWLLFLASPVVALVLGMLLYEQPVSTVVFYFYGQEFSLTSLMIGMFIHAHLVLVFFRSHGNPKIRGLHPLRFFAVPVLLWGGMMMSSWVMVSVSVLATFWDVYHSALQTFGFGRLYDRKLGIDPELGRRLDWWLNQLFYCGPILAGATMINHFEDFEEFEEVESAFFTSIPAFMETNQVYFTWSVIALGTAFVAYYVFWYWRMHRQGQRVSGLKVWLLASTGIVSIYTWGFNSWGMAFFIMNLFHALQYFGLVWFSEKRNLQQMFGLGDFSFGKPLTLGLFLLLPLAYGFWVEALDSDIESLWAITLVVSIMHFWYDGFIWSVRREQV